jgi:hypothetical protein
MCKIGPPGETGAATGCNPVTHARWPFQAMGYDAHFYEPATGGHSYGQDHADMAAFISPGYSFLRQAIGWTQG